MGEFRIGRKFAQHFYPSPKSAGASLLPLARNFASGTNSTFGITVDGEQVLWSSLDSDPLSPPTPDVPITPQSTGVIRVASVIAIKSTSSSEEFVTATVQIGGIDQPVPANERVSVLGNGFAVVPIFAEVSGLVIGTTVNVEIFLTASADNALVLALESSTIDIQEVPVSTG